VGGAEERIVRGGRVGREWSASRPGHRIKRRGCYGKRTPSGDPCQGTASGPVLL